MPHRIVSNKPMHIHPHVSLMVKGHPVAVPSQIGIAPQLYRSHVYDSFIGDMGAAPIHTHDSSGKLHVESSVTVDYTLGDFLDIWGVNLKNHTVDVTVDGKPVQAYRDAVLRDRQQIVIDIDH